LQCLEAGVPLLAEKPLAATLAEGMRICDAADVAGLPVAVGYVTRFNESNQLMRGLLRRGAFGRVRRFAYQFGTRGGWAPFSAYNLDRASTGGGVLVTTGTHFLDRMLDWFGYPVRAELRDDSYGGPEANAVATFEFDHPSGPIDGSARFSKSIVLAGGIVLDTEAGIVILQDRPGAQISARAEELPQIETVFRARTDDRRSSGPGEFVLQLQDFIVAVRTGVSPMVPARSGLVSLRLIEQLYRKRRPLSDDWYARVPGLEANP
jgi:predicted dehydrogenase